MQQQMCTALINGLSSMTPSQISSMSTALSNCTAPPPEKKTCKITATSNDAPFKVETKLNIGSGNQSSMDGSSISGTIGFSLGLGAQGVKVTADVVGGECPNNFPSLSQSSQQPFYGNNGKVGDKSSIPTKSIPDSGWDGKTVTPSPTPSATPIDMKSSGIITK